MASKSDRLKVAATRVFGCSDLERSRKQTIWATLAARDLDEVERLLAAPDEELAGVLEAAVAGTGADTKQLIREVLEEAGLGDMQQMIRILLLGSLPTQSSSSQSTRAKEGYRRAAIDYYDCYTGRGSEQEQVMCMLTGDLCNKTEITAGHIYQQRWPSTIAVTCLKLSRHDPSNIIIMRAPAEKAFDHGHWIIIPERPDQFRIHVLKPDLLSDPMQQYVAGNTGKGTRWQDVHQQLLKIPSMTGRPSRTACSVHAMAHIVQAEGHGWIERGAIVLPQAAWESPRFDKGLMDKFLGSL